VTKEGMALLAAQKGDEDGGGSEWVPSWVSVRSGKLEILLLLSVLVLVMIFIGDLGSVFGSCVSDLFVFRLFARYWDRSACFVFSRTAVSSASIYIIFSVLHLLQKFSFV
jgi:hypothetical protein